VSPIESPSRVARLAAIAPQFLVDDVDAAIASIAIGSG
jgi:hypothetical protein